MNAPIHLVYIGSPSFSSLVLKRVLTELKDIVTVTAVITQPDKPVGRKQIITPTAVKEMAVQYFVPVCEDIQSPEAQNALKDSDLALLYAYGLLIPDKILTLPRWGFWNIHPSLLPKYRGTSPIAYALLMGDTKTGVSLMEMDSCMDHGPILDQKSYIIDEKDTREMLENRLSDIGYELFKENVQLLINGLLCKTEQIHHEATFTRLLTKNDGFIPYTVFKKIVQNEDLAQDDIPPIITEYCKKYNSLSTVACPSKPSYSNGRSGDFRHLIFDFFRGISPWPGVWTLLPNEKRLKITRMVLHEDKPVITHVQLEGKKEVEITTFLHSSGF